MGHNCVPLHKYCLTYWVISAGFVFTSNLHFCFNKHCPRFRWQIVSKFEHDTLWKLSRGCKDDFQKWFQEWSTDFVDTGNNHWFPSSPGATRLFCTGPGRESNDRCTHTLSLLHQLLIHVFNCPTFLLASLYRDMVCHSEITTIEVLLFNLLPNSLIIFAGFSSLFLLKSLILKRTMTSGYLSSPFRMLCGLSEISLTQALGRQQTRLKCHSGPQKCLSLPLTDPDHYCSLRLYVPCFTAELIIVPMIWPLPLFSTQYPNWYTCWIGGSHRSILY